MSNTVFYHDVIWTSEPSFGGLRIVQSLFSSFNVYLFDVCYEISFNLYSS